MPAREVGGDFFNYFELDNGQVALLVGDVSGKGVGAALLMANIQASLRTRLALGQDLSAIAEAIDRDIEANSPGPVYATLFVGDPRSGDARAALRERRPQPAVRAADRRRPRADGVDRAAGRPAGRATATRSAKSSSRPATCCSSTPTAASRRRTTSGEMFGAERLEALVAARAAAAPTRCSRRVEARDHGLPRRPRPFDDATMMAVRVG